MMCKRIAQKFLTITPSFTIDFAFDLIDFLEDWLINHLLDMDQKYKKCFHDHGLK
jgi:hemerythrin